MPSLRIGLIGDHDANVPAHRAIPRALEFAAAPFLDGGQVEVTWLPTETLAVPDAKTLTAKLSSFGGLWCVPASPYASEAGALAAIRYARENAVPFLGTCGGFQHALLEYARNVCDLFDAAHAEIHPDVTAPLITTLECSLVETEGRILFADGSRVRKIYGRSETIEPYHCRYGLNAAFESRLDDGRLRFSGRDAAGEVRVLELDGEPFFVATLFQPERAALRGEGHPLISAYVEAILRRAGAG